MKSKPALIGGIICCVFAIIAILSPLIAPFDPLEVHLQDTLRSPSFEYLLGTDFLGRDIFSRILYGITTSFFIGILSMLGAAVIGVIIGMIAGYFSGYVDTVVMRGVDVIMAIPLTLLAIGFMSFLGSGADKVIIISSIALSPGFARIVRGSVLSIKSSDYILAAKGLGLSDFRIMFRHIMPNLIGPIIVLATLTLSFAIALESALSFLGVGVPPSTQSLGALCDEGRAYFRTFPYLVTFSGLTITLIVLSVNLFGEGLNKILEPRKK